MAALPTVVTRFEGNIQHAYRDGEAVVKSDTVNQTHCSKAIWVGVTGDITAVMSSGAVLLYKAVPVGFLIIEAIRINSTGTAATNMLFLW